MTENNFPNITVSTVPSNNLDLLSVIRSDLHNQISPELTPDDVKAHILVSVVGNGVFVASLIENQAGEFRYGDITPTSIYELWQLKTAQASADKGAWFSVQFTADEEGFIVNTSYNYDKQIFSGDTPERWYIEPAEPTDLYKAPWDVVDYKSDIQEFPRHDDNVPEWLK